MIKFIRSIRENYFDNTVELSKLSKTFFLWGSGLALVYIANIFLIRLIGLKQYGEYTVFINWAGLAVTLVIFGWDGYLVQRIPQLPLNDDGKIRAGHLFRRSFWSFLALFSLLILGVFALNYFSAISIFTHSPAVPILFLLLVFFLAFIGFAKSVLKIFHIVTAVQIFEDLVKPLLLLIIVLLFYGTQHSLHLSSFYLLNVVLASVVALGLIVLVYRKLAHRFALNDREAVSPNWLRQCFYFMCIMMGYSIFSRMELLFLGYYVKNEDAARYQILLRIADLVILPDFLFNYYLPQQFSRLFSTDKIGDAHRLFRNAARTIFLLQFLCLSGVAAIGYFYLQSFGIEGRGMYLMLLVLCSSQLFYSLFGSCNLVLMTSGNEKYSFIALAIVIVLEAAANIFFIASFGLKAAVYISWGSVLLYTLLLYYFTNRRLGFSSPLIGGKDFKN